MESTNMSFFHRFLNSIINFGFYKNYIRQSSGRAVAYLLLVSLVFGLVTTIRPIYSYNSVITEVINAFEDNVPEFVFENGELNVLDNMPIITGDESYPIIIDTTGQTGEGALDDYDNGILILKTQMIQKTGARKSITYFKEYQALSFTKQDVERIIPLLRWGVLFIIIFWPLSFIFTRFISVFILSLIGLIAINAKKMRLPYSDLFKLSAYSVTLPIILATIIKVTGVNVRFFSLIYLAIGFLYLWNALGVVKEDQEYVI